jgi:hypothetical protein
MDFELDENDGELSVDLDDFVTLDESDDFELIPYSIFVETVDTPMPVGIVIVKYSEYIAFVYYNREKDVWVLKQKESLSGVQMKIPVDSVSYFGDSVGFTGSDCEVVWDVYGTIRDTLYENYNISSLEPIEVIDPTNELSSGDNCGSCTEIEKFTYHTIDGRGDILLNICRDCHTIKNVEFAGKKYTPSDLTLNYLLENADISVYGGDKTDMYFIEGEVVTSLFDAKMAVLWWNAFRSLGGIEKYAPDIQRSVIAVQGSNCVGFITWQYLKSFSETPVVQQVYFADSIEKSLIFEYLNLWRTVFDIETYFTRMELTEIPYSPINIDAENTSSFVSIHPEVIVDSGS